MREDRALLKRDCQKRPSEGRGFRVWGLGCAHATLHLAVLMSFGNASVYSLFGRYFSTHPSTMEA